MVPSDNAAFVWEQQSDKSYLRCAVGPSKALKKAPTKSAVAAEADGEAKPVLNRVAGEEVDLYEEDVMLKQALRQSAAMERRRRKSERDELERQTNALMHPPPPPRVKTKTQRSKDEAYLSFQERIHARTDLNWRTLDAGLGFPEGWFVAKLYPSNPSRKDRIWKNNQGEVFRSQVAAQRALAAMESAPAPGEESVPHTTTN